MSHSYFVYIMTNPGRSVLYIGVTQNLLKRVQQHKDRLTDGFTKKYHVSDLIYYEETDSIMGAIGREKQLKGWRREKKESLIKKMNPDWIDLAYRI